MSCVHAHPLRVCVRVYWPPRVSTFTRVRECGWTRVRERRGELRGCGQSDALPWTREGPDPAGIVPGWRGWSLHLTPSGAVTGSRWIIGISTPPAIKCFNYDYYRNSPRNYELRIVQRDTWEPPQCRAEGYFPPPLFFEVIGMSRDVDLRVWFRPIEQYFWASNDLFVGNFV